MVCRIMRTGRSPGWPRFLLLTAALLASSCSIGAPIPAPTPPGPDWLSVRTTLDRTDIIMERVTYRSGNLVILGQVCRPASVGPHPVLIWNHGGFAGLTDWRQPDGFCANAAKDGWALAEASYRGEDGSSGDVEVCLGEVDDVLAMLEVVRRQDWADADRVAMAGVSHGGCITSRAVERGADVDAAVDIAGPTNWGRLMTRMERAATRPWTDPALRQFYETLVAQVDSAAGGGPDQYPKRYAERSPDAEKIARWDKPFLIMHGNGDAIVPVRQSCALATRAGDFRARRFDARGASVTQAPRGCEQLDWGDRSGRSNADFDGDRHLLVYDKVDHFLVDGGDRAPVVQDLFAFLEAKLPG